MTLISLLPAAVLPARPLPSRFGSVIIRSFSLSATNSPDFISASRCYRLPTTRSRLWAWPKGSRPHVFQRSGVRACTLMTLGVAATLISPTSERSRGLKRIRYAASNSIKSCWNGPAKSGSTLAPDAAILDVACRVDAATTRMRVRALVDATGRGGLIARKFNLRTEEPRLANIAIFSHYTGVPRLEGPRPDDIRLIARSDAGWFWLIPISKELMSVGVVLPKLLYRRMANGSAEETLNRAISDTPIVAEFMREARREWPVRVEKDFSYSASTYAGHRWILAGDAGSFLDPVFSTGVSIAMESGIEAAAELHRALARDDFSDANFAAFSRRQRKRFQTFRRFVVGFYTPEFRDVFFSPKPPDLIFRSVVTILAGKWNPSLWTRFFNHLFFGLVSIQKRFNLTRLNFRRDPDAGYPTEPAPKTRA